MSSSPSGSKAPEPDRSAQAAPRDQVIVTLTKLWYGIGSVVPPLGDPGDPGEDPDTAPIIGVKKGIAET